MGQESKDKNKKIFNNYPSKIEAMPKRSLLARGIETVTGIPTDPDFYRNASRQDIFMNTAPQVASGVLGSLAGRLGSATKAIAGPIKGAIAKDPFGLKAGPMDRRVFLDRLMGNTTKRAKDKSEGMWNDYADLTQRSSYPHNHPNRERDMELAEKAFNKIVDFDDAINTAKGWPNAVNNPELIGRMGDTISTTSGVFNRLKDILKERIKQ